METTSRFHSRYLAIETAEAIVFSLPLAGPITRFLAWSIDMLVILVVSWVAYRCLYLVAALEPDLMTGLAVLSAFLLSISYGIVLEWLWRGQTVGKRALGLRVIDADGRRLQPAQIVVRNLMRSLDSLPGLYLVGGASLVLTRRYQRLGDLVSNTVVVRRRQVSLPELASVVETDQYNSFREAPHLVARLRANTSPELAHLAYWALLRRNDLSPEVRIEVFRQVSERFRAIVQFPQELTFALTDERYVRNALGVLADRTCSRKRVQQPT
jgi:uncharacterized RDD family membrane protein YckC